MPRRKVSLPIHQRSWARLDGSPTTLLFRLFHTAWRLGRLVRKRSTPYRGKSTIFLCYSESSTRTAYPSHREGMIHKTSRCTIQMSWTVQSKFLWWQTPNREVEVGSLLCEEFRYRNYLSHWTSFLIRFLQLDCPRERLSASLSYPSLLHWFSQWRCSSCLCSEFS